MGKQKEEEDKKKHYYDGMLHIAIGKPFLYDVSHSGFYTNQDLFTYIVLKMVSISRGTSSHSQKMKTVVTIDTIVSMMGLSSGSRNKKLITESLERLHQGGMITSYVSFSFNEKVEEFNTQGVMYLMLEETIKGEDKWYKIHDEEYNKIVNSGERNASKLMHVFSIIASDIYEEGYRKSFITNNEIIESTGIDKKTVTKYIKLLEDIKVISRMTISVKKDNGDTNKKNIITRYGFRDALCLADNESLLIGD